ncbi:MAG TPA: hypothetical protein VKA86_13180 [Candidatus Krumholzibacteria bacterium]|nr:hypothetical protein [Candidatus Krumholzibacteria bacterium]
MNRFHRRVPRRSSWWLVLVLLFAVSCGDDSGTGPTTTSPVRFEPEPGPVSISAVDSLLFEVYLGDQAKEATFAVDGVDVATAAVFEFVPGELGPVEITARVEVDGRVQTATWTVEVGEGDLRPTPAVDVLIASEGSAPGSIDLIWERPASSRTDVDIVAYEIAYRLGDLPVEDFDDAIQRTVDDSVGPIIQRLRLDGLAERESYTVRIRAIDRVGRRSQPSTAAVTDATGRYRFHGVVEGLRLGRPVEALEGVVLSVGDRFVVTDAAGRFDMPALPDTGDVTLRAVEQSGAQYYELEIHPLEPVDQQFDLVMLQKGVVEIPGGDPGAISRLEFLRIMTANEEIRDGVSYPFYGWDPDLYPVPVYVHPYVHDASGQLVGERQGERVDYVQGFEAAVAAWNDAAGEELMRIVHVDEPFDPQNPPPYGAYYTADIESSNPLGTNVLERPLGGQLFRTEPQVIRLRLQAAFNFNDVALKVIVHELGHTVGLRHDSPAPPEHHLMVATIRSNNRDAPHPEEALVARFLRHATGRIEAQWLVDPSEEAP